MLQWCTSIAFYISLLKLNENHKKMDVKNLLVGGAGVGGVEIISQIEPPQDTSTGEIIKVVLQIIVSIATLFGMFKKNKNTNS